MEIKIVSKDIVDFDLPAMVENVYLMRNELDVIGYGFLNYGSNNDLEIFIKEDYRGNHYGKNLFAYLLNEVKDRKELKFHIDHTNYPMIRIIEKYNPLNMGTSEGVREYLIIKKD